MKPMESVELTVDVVGTFKSGKTTISSLIYETLKANGVVVKLNDIDRQKDSSEISKSLDVLKSRNLIVRINTRQTPIVPHER